MLKVSLLFKNLQTFLRNKQTQEFSRFRMQNFQVIVFIRTKHREIFKSALVYLQETNLY